MWAINRLLHDSLNVIMATGNRPRGLSMLTINCQTQLKSCPAQDRYDYVEKVIFEHKPDVVFLQELTPSRFTKGKGLVLPHVYHFFNSGSEAGLLLRQGTFDKVDPLKADLMRFFDTGKHVKAAKYYGRICGAVGAYSGGNGKKVALFSWHGPYNKTSENDKEACFIGLEEALAEFAERNDDIDCLVWAGDFNFDFATATRVATHMTVVPYKKRPPMSLRPHIIDYFMTLNGTAAECLFHTTGEVDVNVNVRVLDHLPMSTTFVPTGRPSSRHTHSIQAESDAYASRGQRRAKYKPKTVGVADRPASSKSPLLGMSTMSRSRESTAEKLYTDMRLTDNPAATAKSKQTPSMQTPKTHQKKASKKALPTSTMPIFVALVKPGMAPHTMQPMTPPRTPHRASEAPTHMTHPRTPPRTPKLAHPMAQPMTPPPRPLERRLILMPMRSPNL